MQRCLLIIAASLGLAGCGTPPKTAGTKGAEEEYVYVTVTGSNIPKRVKKSDLVKGTVAKDVDTQQINKDDFARSLRSGRQMDRGNN
jgi:starvation-inducible outer membrane lipoprotein